MIFSEAFGLLCVIVTFVAAATNETNYCEIPGCGQRHIACRNKGKFAKICPKDAKRVNLKKHIHFVLSLHNDLRNEIAGGKDQFKPAVRMPEIHWNDELAKYALMSAKTCNIKDSSCIRSEQFPTPSQNKGSFGYTGEKGDYTVEWLISNRFKSWASHRTDATMPLIKNYTKQPDKHVSRFIRLIDERNTHIGCGAVQYVEEEFHRFLLICIYAVSSVPGKPIYTSGEEPGSKCPAHSVIYPNLCTKDEEVE